MQNSKIEWTDHTFNARWGCVNISPACDHCYAERFANRRTRTRDPLWGKDAGRLISNDDYWAAPRQWDRRARLRGIQQRVFCGSMCDVMERREDLTAPRRRLFQLMEDTPNLVWMLLTKRPQELRNFLPEEWLNIPRPTFWLLTTMEHQDYVWRIEELLKAPAIVHGISMESLLGPITLPKGFLESGKRAWVITGRESGPGARPTRIEWVREVRDAAVAAGVPFHFKQWGEHGANLIKIGKKQAGRILDGREWDELPLGAWEQEANLI